MREQRKILAQRADGSVESATLDISDAEEGRLVFSGAGVERMEAAGVDLFGAFQALRRQLEDRQVRLLCAGARTDVFPSGMSRSMSGGRKA